MLQPELGIREDGTAKEQQRQPDTSAGTSAGMAGGALLAHLEGWQGRDAQVSKFVAIPKLKTLHTTTAVSD